MDEVGIGTERTEDDKVFSRAGPVRLLPSVDSMDRSRYFGSLRNENAVTLLPVTPISSLASHIRSLKPDVVAILSRNTSITESRAYDSLRQALSSVPAILLTSMAGNSSTKELAADLSIASLLSEDLTPQQLVIAIQAVAAGLVVSQQPSLEAGEAYDVTDHKGFLEDPLEHLTPRELVVLRLMALGRGNKEIASQLHISEHTAKFHVSSILGKVGANSRTEAVTIGILRGLVSI